MRRRSIFRSQHGRTPADALSHMWSYHLPHSLPAYGPHRVQRTIDEKEWNAAVSQLVATIREICIYQNKHVDHVRAKPCPADPHNDRIVRLGRHFYFKDSRSVCQFLDLHPSVISVLFEARKRVDGYFGAETLTHLRIFTDPEIDSDSSKLFVLIRTTLPFTDASGRLDRLDEEWWLDQPDEARRLLNIDVEYVDASV